MRSGNLLSIMRHYVGKSIVSQSLDYPKSVSYASEQPIEEGNAIRDLVRIVDLNDQNTYKLYCKPDVEPHLQLSGRISANKSTSKLDENSVRGEHSGQISYYRE